MTRFKFSGPGSRGVPMAVPYPSQASAEPEPTPGATTKVEDSKSQQYYCAKCRTAKVSFAREAPYCPTCEPDHFPGATGKVEEPAALDLGVTEGLVRRYEAGKLSGHGATSVDVWELAARAPALLREVRRLGEQLRHARGLLGEGYSHVQVLQDFRRHVLDGLQQISDYEDQLDPEFNADGT